MIRSGLSADAIAKRDFACCPICGATGDPHRMFDGSVSRIAQHLAVIIHIFLDHAAAKRVGSGSLSVCPCGFAGDLKDKAPDVLDAHLRTFDDPAHHLREAVLVQRLST